MSGEGVPHASSPLRVRARECEGEAGAVSGDVGPGRPRARHDTILRYLMLTTILPYSIVVKRDVPEGRGAYGSHRPRPRQTPEPRAPHPRAGERHRRPASGSGGPRPAPPDPRRL